MIPVSFSDIQLIFLILFNTFCFLLVLFSVNVKSSRLTRSTKSKLMQSSVERISPNNLLIRHSFIFLTLTLVFLNVFKDHTCNFWFNHLSYSNLGFIIYYIFTIIMLVVLLSFNSKLHFLKNMQKEYIFTISFLNLFLPVIFFSTNILTFFFIVELLSCLILMQFVVGRDFDNLNSSKRVGYFNFKSNFKSYSYINVIFFQYWTSFFSSVLLVFSFLSYINIFGTSEWIIINFLTDYDLSNFSFNSNVKIILTSLTFLTAIFLKLGLAPVHFYKIEVYKGLPFITILFYTVYFFFIFFLYFGAVITSSMSNMLIVWYNLGILFLLVGFILCSFFLFDVSSIKAFFSYSTIVNSLSFFTLFISLN